MYIETSYPVTAGKKARLASPTYSSTTGKCLSFWYHMYGSSIGTLNVKIKRYFIGRPFYYLRWSRSGNHGNRWRIAQVLTATRSNNYIIVTKTSINLTRKILNYICIQSFVGNDSFKFELSDCLRRNQR